MLSHDRVGTFRIDRPSSPAPVASRASARAAARLLPNDIDFAKIASENVQISQRET